jgi:hypothetical protein
MRTGVFLGIAAFRVADPDLEPDPEDLYVFWPLDPDPDPVLRCTDPDPDPSIIKHNIVEERMCEAEVKKSASLIVMPI